MNFARLFRLHGSSDETDMECDEVSNFFDEYDDPEITTSTPDTPTDDQVCHSKQR